MKTHGRERTRGRQQFSEPRYRDSNPCLPATYLVLGLQLPIPAFSRLQHFSTIGSGCSRFQQPNGVDQRGRTQMRIPLGHRQVGQPNPCWRRHDSCTIRAGLCSLWRSITGISGILAMSSPSSRHAPARRATQRRHTMECGRSRMPGQCAHVLTHRPTPEGAQPSRSLGRSPKQSAKRKLTADE